MFVILHPNLVPTSAVMLACSAECSRDYPNLVPTSAVMLACNAECSRDYPNLVPTSAVMLACSAECSRDYLNLMPTSAVMLACSAECSRDYQDSRRCKTTTNMSAGMTAHGQRYPSSRACHCGASTSHPVGVIAPWLSIGHWMDGSQAASWQQHSTWPA